MQDGIFSNMPLRKLWEFYKLHPAAQAFAGRGIGCSPFFVYRVLSGQKRSANVESWCRRFAAAILAEEQVPRTVSQQLYPRELLAVAAEKCFGKQAEVRKT